MEQSSNYPFDLFHPDYEAWLPKWEYAEGAYNADYLAVPTASGDGTVSTSGLVSSKAARFIPRVPLGEHKDRYAYMLATLDPDGLLSYTLGSLAGQIRAVGDKAVRTWGYDPEAEKSPFGDPEDTESAAYRLIHDADGEGSNWEPMFSSITEALFLVQRPWFLVEGFRSETVTGYGDAKYTFEQQATAHMLHPSTVPYWKKEKGLITEVHHASKRMTEDGKEADVRRIYRFGGWEEWERVGEGAPYKTDRETTYEYWADGTKTKPRLPIFRGWLPFKTYVFYNLARKRMAALNQSARGDVATLTASVTKLVHKSNTAVQSTGTHPFLQQVIDGASVFVIGADEDVEYRSPDMGAATEARTRGEEKDKAFLRDAYQQYNDAARQRTATEVAQRSQSGEGAILSTVTETLDEIENTMLLLLAQAENKDATDLWATAYAERSTDFIARDEAEKADKLMDRLFPSEAVPAGRTARRAGTVRFAEAHELDYDAEEIDAELDAMEARAGRVGVLPGLEDFAPGRPGPEPVAGEEVEA